LQGHEWIIPASRKLAAHLREHSIAARGLHQSIGVQDGLQVVPEESRKMTAFLLAQLQWERYRASRTVLVHVLALSGLLYWVPMPGWLRTPIAAACGTCFLGALFAGMMEWRWGRERNRRAGVTSRPGDRG
jgi:hypothetical protein